MTEHVQAEWDTFVAQTNDYLEQAFANFQQGTSVTSSVVLEAARHLCLSRHAKRARARLVLSVARLLGGDPAAVVPVAAAAELIHAASLLHDDVVDHGQRRRGLATLNVQWGNSAAVLTGDLVLVLGLEALRDHPTVISHAVDMIGVMVRAALDEVLVLGRVDTTPEAWEQIALGKTGALFGWCGRATAMVFGASDETAAALDRFGRALGIAFQMADDVKDLAATDTGKDRFADLRNRNPSFVILNAVAESPTLRAQLADMWSSSQIDEPVVQALGETIATSDAIARTRRRIEEVLDDALTSLAAFADTPRFDFILAWVDALWRRLPSQLGTPSHHASIPHTGGRI